MRLRKFLCASLAALFLSSSLVVPSVRADEGMWTFNNVPRAEIERKYHLNLMNEPLRAKFSGRWRG